MWQPTWLLTGSEGMWAADCIVSGCLWTITTSDAETADAAAITHALTEHPERAEVDA
jgi:hypothetical protein